jgi:DNA primase
MAREALDRDTVPVPTARGLIRYESRLSADIRVATMPPGKDPDDVLKEGLEVWQAIIQNATPVVDFYFDTVTAGLNLNEAKDKSTAVKELLPVLRDISDKVEQQHYLQKLARLVRVDERTLAAELKHKQKSPVKAAQLPVPDPFTPVPPPQPISHANFKQSDAGLEEYCLSLVVAHPAALAQANYILEEQKIDGLTLSDFKKGENKDIFKAVQLWTALESPKIEVLVEIVDSSLEGYLATLANAWHQRPPTPVEGVYRDLTMAILRLRLQNVLDQIKDLSFLQQESIDRQDYQSARQYTEMVETYRQKRKLLEHTRDALSITGKRRTEAIY